MEIREAINQFSKVTLSTWLLTTLLLLCGNSCKSKSELNNYCNFENIKWGSKAYFQAELSKNRNSQKDTSAIFYDCKIIVDNPLERYSLPKIKNSHAPIYPDRWKKTKIQGDVILEAEIKENGDVGEVIVLKSLMWGDGNFDESAIYALKKWKFKPARNPQKKRCNSWIQLVITFHREDKIDN